jgi:HD-like signal output (HDOD) protein/ActR/RegA family two-component response regulator
VSGRLCPASSLGNRAGIASPRGLSGVKHRILFVDDESRVLQGLRRMLWTMRQEWDMEFVTSGAEALVALDASKFDVVVSDMRMPGMSGAELLERVRERHPEVVRLILTGQASEEAALNSVGPAHQFLSKPCDTDTLRGTIRRTLATRRILKSEHLQDLVSQVGSLPSPSPLYLKIVSELQSASPSMRRVADVIGGDPAMTAKVLQLVNSAFFGVQRQISDPYQATMLLGLKTVSVLVLSIGVFSQFEHSGQGSAGIGGIMPHSANTAARARAIGLSLTSDQELVDHCSAAGLLHDVGKLVLASRLPNEFQEVVRRAVEEQQPFADVERAVFGSTHAEVGGYLLGLWGLTDQVVEAVAFHHAPAEGGDASSLALTTVHVADVLAHEAQPESVVGAPPKLDVAYLENRGLANRVDEWRTMGIA